MRKGIAATLAIFILGQLVAFAIIFSVIRLLNRFYYPMFTDDPGSFYGKYYGFIIVGIATLVFILTFIALGFYLNSKYREDVKYWKFLVTGILSAVVSSAIFYASVTWYHTYSDYYSTPWNIFLRSLYRDLYIIPVCAGFIAVICAVTAIFHKRYKPKKKLHTADDESLDSDITGD